MADPQFREQLAAEIVRDRTLLHVPPGHPYSPIPSAADRARAKATSGPGRADVPGVDLATDEQWALLARLLENYDQTAQWLTSEGPERFDLDNTWFAGADAVLYALMLREIRPQRVIEVGCGYSSALALDVIEEFLDPVTLTLIDPDAARLRTLLSPADLANRLREEPVQDVPLDAFTDLAEGDVLAIDSSHVLRAGSDVQYLLFEVIPALNPGVFVHVHDIFHPFEYPADWLASGTALNEAYAWRTLLQSNSRMRIALWNHYLIRFHREWFAAQMPLCLSAPFTTGGLWVQVSQTGVTAT